MNYLLICDIIFYHLIPYIVCKQYEMCGCVSLCESPGVVVAAAFLSRYMVFRS